MTNTYVFNPNMIFTSVDTGKSSSKYSWLDINGEIRSDVISTLVEPTEIDNEFRGSADKIIMAGKSWLVGGVDGDLIYDESNSKLDTKHEISIYTCIARILVNHLSLDLTKMINISLSINVPLEEYKNKMIKETYIEKYLDKTIEIDFNGKHIQFKIIELDLFFESSGAIIRNYHLVNPEDSLSYTCVVDCGSKNDTHTLFNHQTMPVPGKNRMAGNGINKSLRDLAMELQGILGENTLTVPLVENLLVGKTKLTKLSDDELKNKFSKIATKLSQKIKSTTDALDLPKGQTKILFTGGSSIVLKEYLQQIYEDAGYSVYFSSDARYDNSKGALIRSLNKKRI